MKNAKPIAIHLDRLAAALAMQGVDLKRSQLLEVAASAFGHRTSNETSRLSEAGALTPASAQPIGRIEIGSDTVVLVRDAVTQLPYAIAQSFLEGIADRREQHFAPTPYGGLADLRRIAVSEIPTLEAGRPAFSPSGSWRAIVQTGYGFHGHIFFDESSAASLATEVAAWCVEHWDTARVRSSDLPSPSERARMSDLEVIQAYFEAWAGDECLLMEDQESLTDIIETIRNGILDGNGPLHGAQNELVSDGRYRAYPATDYSSDMPDEADYLSSHDTLEAAIAACENEREEHRDAAVSDHVGRKFWRASHGWQAREMPELAVSADPDITTFHLAAKDLLQHEVADELRRLGDMVDDGYNQGETMRRGWWWLNFSEKAKRDAMSDGEHGECQRCDSPIDVDGHCTDETCPFSECMQDDPRGWSGHPDMDPETGYRFVPPAGITPLRAARIQHAILNALENGLIDKREAAIRLHTRLSFSMTIAQAVVDGDHDGANC